MQNLRLHFFYTLLPHVLRAEVNKLRSKQKHGSGFLLFHEGPPAPCSSPAEFSADVLTMSQVFTAPPRPPPPSPREHRRHGQGRVAVIYSQRSSPSERPLLARSLAASTTGRVGKCLQWFPSKSGSLGSTTFAAAGATGEPRQVALGWVRLAAARWPPFSFPPGQGSSKGTTLCARVFQRQEAFLCSTCRE